MQTLRLHAQWQPAASSQQPAASSQQPYLSYDQVPWYRKNWFAILCFFIFMPALFLVVLTGNVFYERKGQVRRYSILARIFLILYSGLATLLFGTWLFGPENKMGQQSAGSTSTSAISSPSGSESTSDQTSSNIQSDSDSPPDSFMTSELMVRPGIQETGISVEQFVAVAKHIPLKDGSCSELGAWKKRGKEYFTSLKLGDDTYKLVFWPYSADFVVLDPVKFGLFDTKEVPAQQFMMLVLAGAQGAARQPDACGGNAPNGKSWLSSARGPRTQSNTSGDDQEIAADSSTALPTDESVQGSSDSSVPPAASVATPPTEAETQTVTYTDSDNTNWIFTPNNDGGVLKSQSDTIYIVKSCDATSKLLGAGRWAWTNGGFTVIFPDANKKIGFPNQEMQIDNNGDCAL